MFYRALGFVVWQAAKWYVRRRAGACAVQARRRRGARRPGRRRARVVQGARAGGADAPS